MILHAAESCGAGLLYSEDLSHGQRYGAVEVVNPLRANGRVSGIDQTPGWNRR